MVRLSTHCPSYLGVIACCDLCSLLKPIHSSPAVSQLGPASRPDLAETDLSQHAKLAAHLHRLGRARLTALDPGRDPLGDDAQPPKHPDLDPRHDPRREGRGREAGVRGGQGGRPGGEKGGLGGEVVGGGGGIRAQADEQAGLGCGEGESGSRQQERGVSEGRLGGGRARSGATYASLE